MEYFTNNNSLRSQRQQPKTRPTSSCIPCRSRKVKCNRLSPCEACIVKGIEDECHYSANDEDRLSIAQSDAITSLRSKVESLRNELLQFKDSQPLNNCIMHNNNNNNNNNNHDDDEMQLQLQLQPEPEPEAAAMEAVYAALENGSPDFVRMIVSLIRSGVCMEDVARFVRQWSSSSSASGVGMGSPDGSMVEYTTTTTTTATTTHMVMGNNDLDPLWGGSGYEYGSGNGNHGYVDGYAWSNNAQLQWHPV